MSWCLAPVSRGYKKAKEEDEAWIQAAEQRAAELERRLREAGLGD
jgi:hypothetical protein